MSRTATRVAILAALAAGVVALALWAWRDRGGPATAQPASTAAQRALPALASDPARLPDPPADGATTVMLLLGVDDAGRIALDGPPIELSPSSLRFARAITSRRTTAPPMWAFVREADADVVRYWVPLNPSDAIRVNVRDDGDEAHHQGALERIPEMYQTIRVPFWPRAVVEFVHADGTSAGAFRFGDRPTDPAVEVP